MRVGIGAVMTCMGLRGPRPKKGPTLMMSLVTMIKGTSVIVLQSRQKGLARDRQYRFFDPCVCSACGIGIGFLVRHDAIDLIK